MKDNWQWYIRHVLEQHLRTYYELFIQHGFTMYKKDNYGLPIDAGPFTYENFPFKDFINEIAKGETWNNKLDGARDWLRDFEGDWIHIQYNGFKMSLIDSPHILAKVYKNCNRKY